VRFDLDTPRGRYRDLRAPLRGEYQARNAAVAIAAVEELEGAALRPARVRRGLAATRWPGRLEEFHGPRRTLLDGAHNAEGAAGLAGYLRRRSGPLHLVFGALADKAIGAMAEALFPLADAVYLTPVPGPRGAHPEEIAARSGGLAPALSIWPSARAALDAAWRACPRSGLVVVAGSLYLAGALRPVLRRAGSRSGSKRLPSTSRTRSS
jgi:dihydrofolate synthase/folylpolyglutamate synthase